MLKIVVDDIYQVSFLEMELVNRGISFERVCNEDYAQVFDRPFLIIDGVPLDFERSLKWIKEYDNEHK